MSWFVRSFSMKEEAGVKEDLDDDEDDEEEGEEILDLAAIASATGASVKEDLSSLTKTFTRQLWGVASFLAPPPQASEKSSISENLVRSNEEVAGGTSTDEEIQTSSGAENVDSRRRGRFKTIGLEKESNLAVVESASADTSDESYPHVVASSPNDGEEIFKPNQGHNRPMLKGVRNDFAELRGSMATGLSRISSSVIRVVAGDDSSGGEEEDHFGHSDVHSFHPPSRSIDDDHLVDSPRRAFDSFLKPLFGNMLSRDRSSSADSKDLEISGKLDVSGKDIDARLSRGQEESKQKDVEVTIPSAIVSGIDGISKFASGLLQIVKDEDEDDDVQVDAVGISDIVVTFATNIATHPETWLDFPLTDDEKDDDFKLTLIQKEHVRALEIAAPGLAALKVELCPNYMTEERFWKIYFVLMHSRLSSDEARLLSTQQVVRARLSMIRHFQNQGPVIEESLQGGDQDLIYDEVQSDMLKSSQLESKNDEEEDGSNSTSICSAATMNPTGSSFIEDTRQEGEGNQLAASIVVSVEALEPKNENRKEGSVPLNVEEDETEADAWLEEESSTKHIDLVGDNSQLSMSNMAEDVSFSDLEEDDSPQQKSKDKSSSNTYLESTVSRPLITGEGFSHPLKGEGTPFTSLERGEFTDWLTVNQEDLASASSSP